MWLFLWMAQRTNTLWMFVTGSLLRPRTWSCGRSSWLIICTIIPSVQRCGLFTLWLRTPGRPLALQVDARGGHIIRRDLEQLVMPSPEIRTFFSGGFYELKATVSVAHDADAVWCSEFARSVGARGVPVGQRAQTL